MKTRITNRNILFITFFLLCLSVSGFFTMKGFNNLFSYLGYFLILLKTLNTFIKKRSFRREVLTLSNFLIIFALLIGIIVQHMNIAVKIRLILTMGIIINFALFSKGVAIGFEDIRASSHGIFFGIIVVFLIGIITDSSLFGRNDEGYLQFAFTAGFLHKNIFGFLLLSSFSGLIIYWKFVSKKTIDLIVLVIEIVFFILSNARGAIFLALIFFVLVNLSSIVRLIKINLNLFLFFIFLSFVGCFYYFFNKIALNSGTFAYRLSGLIGWLVLFGNNNHVMLFGNAAEAFSGSDYTNTVRSMINWTGTVEMGLLSILVKNGIVGLIGYIMVFLRAFKSLKQTKEIDYKLSILALLVTMILSILTEPYLVNTAVCYGVFSFMVLSLLSSMACYQYPVNKKTIKDSLQLV